MEHRGSASPRTGQGRNRCPDPRDGSRPEGSPESGDNVSNGDLLETRLLVGARRKSGPRVVPVGTHRLIGTTRLARARGTPGPGAGTFRSGADADGPAAP